MSTSSFMARAYNAWRAILNPISNLVEHELAQDRAQRDPDERIPTKRQYEMSRYAAVGLENRVRKSSARRAAMSKRLLAAKASADAADKAITDFAQSPAVVEARERAATFRADHPLHEERLTFRGARVPTWARIALEAAIIVADWGVWFTLLTVGSGLSFTKMASPTDPTKVYNPEWFIAHPIEWGTAFVVPTIAAIITLVVGKIAARLWAQSAALRMHPERAKDLAVRISRWKLGGWGAAIIVLGAALYLVAAHTFMEFADELGWLIGAPWALIPLGVFLVERYGRDPIGEVDAIILGTAAQVESRKESLTAALMRAEDVWRGAWTAYDDLLRTIIDGASGDLNLYDQLMAHADAVSGHGQHLAPISTGAEPIVGRTIAAREETSDSPARAIPVVLEVQRGLITKVAPWVTKQIELDIQVLTDCRPPIDSGATRSARITRRFETAYEAARKSVAERAAARAEVGREEATTAQESASDADATPEAPNAGISDESLDRLLAEEAAAQ